MKGFRRFVAIILAAAFMAGGAALQAANFRDVGPAWAWAQDAINAVTGAGIMTGDLEGNFRPASSVSKFDAVRILARMSGFNPDALSPQDAAYYEAVYQARRGIIENAEGRFSTWNSGFNREIAYLLYADILIPSDLQNFITISGGQETARQLMREEAAVYLVRFMGRTQEALRTANVVAFNDDHLISPGARPHVYFLRSLGILNGDGTGNLNPRGAASRAAMAMLVYATLNEENSPLLGHSPGGALVFETMAATIANTYPSFRTILTESNYAPHHNRIFPLARNAIITVDGRSATFGDLSQGMTFRAMLQNQDIVSIEAQSVGRPTPTPFPTHTPLPTPFPAPTDVERRVLSGTVAGFSLTDNTVSIETRMLSPRNEIITEVRIYTLTAATTITRGGVAANQNSIEVGDLAVAYVYGSRVANLELEERFRQISGILTEKDFSASSIFPPLVVRDADGRHHSFTADAQSMIYRTDTGNISPRSLRIGDAIDISAEFGRITQATAHGISSTADVYIRDIFISGREQSHIVVSDAAGFYDTPDRLHLIVDGTIDVYALTVGSHVRLWLDSEEVVDFALLATAAGDNFTGHIMHISHNEIVVRDQNFVTRSFTHDAATVFFNSVTGRSIHLAELSIGMRVQIVGQQTDLARAASVTLLIN